MILANFNKLLGQNYPKQKQTVIPKWPLEISGAFKQNLDDDLHICQTQSPSAPPEVPLAWGCRCARSREEVFGLPIGLFLRVGSIPLFVVIGPPPIKLPRPKSSNVHQRKLFLLKILNLIFCHNTSVPASCQIQVFFQSLHPGQLQKQLDSDPTIWRRGTAYSTWCQPTFQLFGPLQSQCPNVSRK